MAEEVQLFGVWGSPFSRRIEIALAVKGVDKYEYIEEDVFNNKSPLLLKYNPVHKKIPVLVHNGKPIAESLVILEYIDEVWRTNPILPEDAYQRAMARFWTKFLDEKCIPALWTACWSRGEEQKKTIEEACEHLKTLEAELKENKFFGGETMGIVDIAANFIAFWLVNLQEVVGLDLLTEEKFPKLYQWSLEFINCSAVKEHLPPRDKLLAFFKARFESMAAASSQ